MSSDLVARLERASRGRPVTITSARNNWFGRDFTVRYDGDTNAYTVKLTEAGCFEEAYRFLERWIARHALIQDNAYEPPPPDHLDLRDEPSYWMLERHSDQLFTDLEQAVARYSSYLEDEMYYVPRAGDIVIEQRVSALRGVLDHFGPVRQDLRMAILSPHTVDVLRAIGILPGNNATAEEDRSPSA